MNKNAIKILQVNASSKFGGVSNMILNYCRNFNKEKFICDFLSPETTSYYDFIEEINNQLNGHIYELGIKFKGPFKYLALYKSMNKFLKQNKYDIIHINSGLLMYNFIVAYVAKKHKIKRIIVHSHSSIAYRGIKKIIAGFIKKMLSKVSTDYLACSLEAAKSMFPAKIINEKKYIILNNAIDVSKYKYNEIIRNEIRTKLNLNNKLVIGHIGRFVKVKNHKFLLEIFSEIMKIHKESSLVLVGDGELIGEIRDYAQKLGVEENVVFLGNQLNTSDFYQAFDVFILPSFYEGLPVVSIEAQTSGLPCYLSNTISKECNLTNNVTFLSLNDSAKEWAIKIYNDYKTFKRKNKVEDIISGGFSIQQETKKLEEIYVGKE